MKPRHVLLSGLPHVGKTTALLRIVESFPTAWIGFVTERLTDQVRKTGLAIVTDDGIHQPVAWKQPSASTRNSTYHIDETLLLSTLDRVFERLQDASFVYVDEISPLYCRSQGFRDRVTKLFHNHHVTAVVSRKGHPLIHTLRSRSDIILYEIDSGNRDQVPGAAIENLRSMNVCH